MEGILDRAITSAKQAAQQPQQQAQGPNPMSDPKVISQQMKGAQDAQLVQANLQADLVREQSKVAGDAQREQAQAEWNTREHAAKTQITEAARAMHPAQSGGLRGMPGGLP